ncbi:MAG: DUF350 domain-containing protein [Candidatus Anstonellales archaeon]
MEVYLILLKVLSNLIYGIFTLMISIRVFDALTKEINEIDEIKRKNISVGIVLSGIIISMSIMIADVLKDSYIPDTIEEFILTTLFDIFRYLFSIIVGISIIFISYNMFRILNAKRFNTILELKNGNIAVALLLTVYFIALMLIITPALKTLFNVIISYNLKVVIP